MELVGYRVRQTTHPRTAHRVGEERSRSHRGFGVHAVGPRRGAGGAGGQSRELERNSRSSSKPPSTDKVNFANPPRPKSLRRKSGRKPGGQKGHRGDTLRQSDSPDRVVEHRLDEGEDAPCPKCGTALAPGPTGALERQHCECRQVFELPAIKIEITEHRAR